MRKLSVESNIDALRKTFSNEYNVVWTKEDDPYIFVTKDFETRDETLVMVLVHYGNAYVLPTPSKQSFLDRKSFERDEEWTSYYLEQIGENCHDMLQIVFSGNPTQIGHILFDESTLEEIQTIVHTYVKSLNFFNN